MRRIIFIAVAQVIVCAVSLALAFGRDARLVAPDFELHDTSHSSQTEADSAVVPLEGLDPVMLTRGEEAQGDEKISVTRGRFRYLFASAETRAAFEREPERFEIQLGGTCARMGPAVRGNPDLFWVYKGRIYLFGSPACVKMFKESPEKYLETDAAPSVAPTAEAERRGRALVERAVEAAGGAARVDALKSYEERATTAARVQQGVAQIKTSLYIVYPGRARQERTLPFGTFATVLAGREAFTVFPRGSAELIDEQRAAFARTLELRLLTILRARRDADFRATAAGATRVGGVAVEQVDVSFGGVRARLGIDAATGRVLSVAYRGRGDSGAFGEIVQTFSDFRAVGGLVLPFKTTATFDGAEEPTLGAQVESIVVNAELPAALFERPKPAGER